MRCLETRLTPEGFRRRRYESASGVRHTTIEVPFELWHGLNRQGRGADRAAAWARERERESMRRQALGLARHNVAAKVIAERLGVSVRSVNRWIEKARKE